jgi:hypothetical protein
MKICIVSGAEQHRFQSDVNHSFYANRHSYDYVFDVGPYHSLQNVFFLKIQAVRERLRLYDWVFWLDDDAFFTGLDTRLESFIERRQRDEFLLVCQGVVSTLRGRFTFLNSGVFLVKNCPDAIEFLDAVSETPLSVVKRWWNPRRVGLYTTGDQDAMTYVLHEHDFMSKVCLLPYNAFNNRPYHYNQSASEHFVVHFRVDNKAEAIRTFGRKFDLDEATLLPHDVDCSVERQLREASSKSFGHIES